MLKKKVGKLLESVLHPLMFKVSYRYRKALNLQQSMPPYVVSQCGQSFKEYILENKMSEKLDKLKANLDEKSKQHVDLIFDRILNFPEYHRSKAFKIDYNLEQTDEEKNDAKSFLSMQSSLRKKYNFPKPFSECVFFYHHGLKLLDDDILDYLQGKDFLDVGSWIGDTALMLHEYSPKKIYSFDISEKVIGEYKNIMDDNGISKEKYTNECLALGKEKKELSLSFYDNDLSTGNTVFTEGDIKVQQITIDEYVQKNSLKVGVIQADIEGAEIDMILGAEKTIKEQMPILLIDIYHRPDQFFELKPLLESWNLGYKFMLRSFKFKNLAIAEVTLIAYPSLG